MLRVCGDDGEDEILLCCFVKYFQDLQNCTQKLVGISINLCAVERILLQVMCKKKDQCRSSAASEMSTALLLTVSITMGKKNKKSRQYDDDDLLGGPLLTSAAAASDDDDKQELDMDTTHVDDKLSSSKAKEQQQRTTNIDLVILEDQMLELLRNDKAEKNMRLPKHSLSKSLESHILDQMRWRVEEMIDKEEADADADADAELPEEDEGHRNENIDHPTISALDEAKLRAEARMSGVDPDEAVDSMKAVVEDDDANDTDIHIKQQPHLGAEELQLLQDNKSFGVSVLLLLRPYTENYPSDKALVTRIFLLLRQCLCIILCQVSELVFGRQAKQQATLLWEKVHLPKIEAELLVKEREEDLQMLKNNAHLWSDEQGCWIEKDAVFSADKIQTLPVTIRYNQARKQWERWSKNLTTRTKKHAEGSSLKKGTFLAVREGDGWATSPDEAEIENKLLKTQYIRIFTCLPYNDGTALDVVDVTSWAAKSLLPIEAAKALLAVDSGKTLFTFDTKRKAGKGKQKRKNKRSETNQTSTEDEWIALKGTGATAQLSKYYLDKMQ